jgi:hypothetical protein
MDVVRGIFDGVLIKKMKKIINFANFLKKKFIFIVKRLKHFFN